jgi:hypothetical protein
MAVERNTKRRGIFKNEEPTFPTAQGNKPKTVIANKVPKICLSEAFRPDRQPTAHRHNCLK